MDAPATRWQDTQPARPKKSSRAALLSLAERVALAAGIAIDRRVGVHQGELELGDRAPEVVERDRRAGADLGEHFAEQPAVARGRVQAPQHLGADGVVVTREVEPRHLDALGGGDEGLRREQVRQVRERPPLGGRELQAGAVVERVAGEGAEARVPHQRRKERRVDRHRRAALVARPPATGADDQIVLDPDGDRLRVAEAVGRRVAAGAGVVVVEPGDGVEPEEPADVGQPPVDGAAEARPEHRADATGEAVPGEVAPQGGVQALRRRDGRRRPGGDGLGPDVVGTPDEHREHRRDCEHRPRVRAHRRLRVMVCPRARPSIDAPGREASVGSARVQWESAPRRPTIRLRGVAGEAASDDRVADRGEGQGAVEQEQALEEHLDVRRLSLSEQVEVIDEVEHDRQRGGVVDVDHLSSWPRS